MDLLGIQIRKAVNEDLIDVVRLLADDPLGIKREKFTEPLPQTYYQAFEKINADKNGYLVVAIYQNKIIATLQINFLTYLACQGQRRALIEAVRVDKKFRGQGVGKLLMAWCINRARDERCYLVELTTDKTRLNAHEFYKKLGFIASHEGMKFYL